MSEEADASGQQGRVSYLRELFQNQLWQSANFVAKGLFLLLLTPLMLARWGSDGYGLFALSSSLLVSMALLDGGVRNLTRIGIAEAHKSDDPEAVRRVYGQGLLTFITVSSGAILLATVLAATGWYSRRY